jgi:hypothetical protein
LHCIVTSPNYVDGKILARQIADVNATEERADAKIKEMKDEMRTTQADITARLETKM